MSFITYYEINILKDKKKKKCENYNGNEKKIQENGKFEKHSCQNTVAVTVESHLKVTPHSSSSKPS